VGQDVQEVVPVPRRVRRARRARRAPRVALDAATTYVVVSATAFAALAGLVPLALPEVLVPGTAPVLGVVAFSVVVLAWTAVRGYRRTGRPAAWWAAWATFVLTVTGACVLDDEIRQLVALSLIVGPVYCAMFMRTSSVLWHVLVAEVCCAALAASTEGPVAVRVLRVLCSFVVSGTLIAGLIVLRRRLDAAREQAHEFSRRDPLTNLLNRRGLHHHLPTLLDEAARGTGVAVLVADLDRFKTVNDTHGHAVGDRVLVAVADALRRASRPDDLLARLGGEELLLVAAVPHVDVPALAERLRATVEGLADPELPSVTISVGGAWSPVAPGWAGPDREEAAESLLRNLSQRADALMYAAKESGRNLARTEA
jgi:diguanylate cyclase (GGDEF)-like protein